MNKKQRIKKGRSDKIITGAVLFLLIYGTLMIASAEMGSQAGNIQATGMVLFKQFIYVFAGLVLMKICSRFDFLALKKSVFNIAAIGCVLILFLCLAYESTMGAKAWIYIGKFSIQPSEFVKVFSMIYIAKYFSIHYKNAQDEKQNIFLMLGIVLFWVFTIVILQKDTGSGIILLVMAYAMFLMGQKRTVFKLQNWMIGLMCFGVIACLFAISPMMINFLVGLESDNYIINRFIAFADPFKHQLNIGYHLVMSLVSFANGGLFGTGFGSSIHKYMNFPNQSNDFILSIIVEELGFVGFLLILIPYTIIIVRLIKHCLREKAETRTRIILLGTMMMLITHFIFNVGGVTGFIPLTGVPLLLISSGGSSTVAFLIAIGLSQYEISRINRSE